MHPLELNTPLTIGEALPDESSMPPDVEMEHLEIEHQLHNWLALLPARQRDVLERRYGLNGRELHTLEQLARELHLTRERVRQIQLEALDALRRIVRRRGLSKETLL